MNSVPQGDNLVDDPAFQAVLVSCFEQLERGQSLDRVQLLAAHPEYAEALDEFLADQAKLKRVASEVRDSISAQGAGRVGSNPNSDTIDSEHLGNGFSAGNRLQYIGEYEVLSEIARGGMGVVFKARQQKLGRIVALKMILSGKLADDADVHRFHREAQAAAGLKHPNIVPVHEVGTHDGHHYFTMDYIEGQSLAQVLRDEAIAPHRAARIIELIAEAVHVAHREGTLHRDRKPANVILDEHDQPHVTDFGLAKIADDPTSVSSHELTATGQVLGTPSYMSPEQASGKHNLVGTASDIYSLGAVLYACLTGRGPFVADSPIDTVLQVIRKDPVSPRMLNPTVPRDLENICLKCLAKDPHKRYGTAHDLADDLNRFLEGRPVAARPVGPTAKTIRWCRRNPAVATLLAAIGLCLTAGTTISSYFAFEANQQANAARAQTTEKEEQRRIAVQATADAQSSRDAEKDARRKAEEALLATAWHLYRARLFPMRDAWDKQQFGHLDRLLKDSIPQAGEPDFRGWEWYFFQDEVDRRYFTIEPVESEFIEAEWSQSGDLLALRREDRNIEIRSGEDFSLLHVLPGERQKKIAWHPSQPLLATAVGQNEIEVWDATTGKTLYTLATEGSDPTTMKNRGIAWNRTGTHLALGGYRRIDIWNAEREHETTLKSPPTWVPAIDWHPDGKRLGASGVGYAFCIDIETDKVLWKDHRHREPVSDVEWDRQGNRLAVRWSWPTNQVRVYDENGSYKKMPATAEGGTVAWIGDDSIVTASSDQQVYLLDVNSESILRTNRYHTSSVIDFDWADERNLGVTVEKLGTAKVWSIEPAGLAATEIPTPAAGGQIPAWGEIAWHAQEDLVACGLNDEVIIADVATAEIVQRFPHPRGVVVSTFALHPSRRVIAYQDRNGKVYVRNIDSGEGIAEFTCDSGDFNRSIAWSPNGRYLAAGSGQDWRSKQGGGVEIWDITTSEKVTSLETKRNRTRVAWSPDSRRLVVGAFSDRRLTILDFATKKEICSAKLTGVSTTVAFSPDGRFVAAGTTAGPVEIVDSNSGESVARLASHSHVIRSVEWSSDGHRIATSADDKTFRIWDAATADELLVFRAEPIESRFVCWSPDGRRLATFSSAGMIRILGTTNLTARSK